MQSDSPAPSYDDIDFQSDLADEQHDGVELAPDSVTTSAEFEKKVEAARLPVTTIRWNGKDYPVLMDQTPAYLARHTINHNRLNGYTLVVFIGRSGTGKSTYTQTLTHYLHTVASKQGHSYAIDWFKQKDIEHLDDIIDSMEKGVDRIMIFEDASFTFNNMRQNEIEAVMAKLTFIRHTLKAHVIIMVQIHYTKALEKFMRDGDLTLITSITHEERENLLKLYGGRNSYIVSKFFQRYHEMNTDGRFFMPLPDVHDNRLFRYKTNHPFRLAMVNDFGKIHFAVYHKTECAFCRQRFKLAEAANKQDAGLEQYLKSASVTYGKSKVRTALKYYFFFKEGIDQLEPRSKYLVTKTVKFFHDNPEAYTTLRDRMKAYVSLDTILKEAGVIDYRTDTRAENYVAKKLEKRKAKELKRMTRVEVPILAVAERQA